MSETNIQTSPNLTTTSADGAAFSGKIRDTAMNVISIAEARARFGKAGMTSQSAGALFRYILGSMGIDLWGSQTEHAARLVRFRAMAAAAIDEELKKAA